MTTSAIFKRITYVEDEPDIRALAVLALERIGGYAVDACPSGFAALERVRRFQPDLILLDVMMPGLDGEETFQRLREIPGMSSVPTVFMTANAQVGDIEHYFALGAHGVITKPFDPISLPERLYGIWDHARGSKGPCRTNSDV